MDQFLLSMKCEDKWVLRRIYSKHLYGYVSSMKKRILYYGPKIPEIINEYLQVSDPVKEETRINILKVYTHVHIHLEVKNTRESRCLAGEPKHFPFAIVFVLIIKITLTCMRGFP